MSAFSLLKVNTPFALLHYKNYPQQTWYYKPIGESIYERTFAFFVVRVIWIIEKLDIVDFPQPLCP